MYVLAQQEQILVRGLVTTVLYFVLSSGSGPAVYNKSQHSVFIDKTFNNTTVRATSSSKLTLGTLF